MLEFVEHGLSALNNNRLFLALFLDFSEAFVTVNHVILLRKHRKAGVREICSQCFFHIYEIVSNTSVLLMLCIVCVPWQLLCRWALFLNHCSFCYILKTCRHALVDCDSSPLLMTRKPLPMGIPSMSCIMLLTQSVLAWITSCNAIGFHLILISHLACSSPIEIRIRLR